MRSLLILVLTVSATVASIASAQCRTGIFKRGGICQPRCPVGRSATTYYPPDPNGCPPNTAEADAQELPREVNPFLYRFSVYNNSDFTVICTMKYTRFEDGLVVADYCCERKLEVPPRMEVFYGEATANPNARYLTQEFLDVWNVVIKR